MHDLVDEGLRRDSDRGWGDETAAIGQLAWKEGKRGLPRDEMIDELDLVLTSGRVGSAERQHLEDMYERTCVYIGCFRDRSGSRWGSEQGYSYPTNALCSARCTSDTRNFKYYSLRPSSQGIRCACGNDLPTNTQLGDRTCGSVTSSWCGRGPCGGTDALAVYKQDCLAGSTVPRSDFTSNIMQKMMLSSSAYHTTQISEVDPNAGRRPDPEPQESGGRRYKAIVIILLTGGMDSHNLLVPHSDCGVHGDLYEDYVRVRGPAAISQADLLQITTPRNTQPCNVYGIHPSYPILRDHYNAGDAAFFANIGAMVEPITQATYNNGQAAKPRGLFGHAIMQQSMQTLVPQAGGAFGVLGRTVKALVEAKTPFSSELYSITGSTVILQGSPRAPFTIDRANGVTNVRDLEARRMISNLTSVQSRSYFAETVNAGLYSSIYDTDLLKDDMDSTRLDTSFRSDTVSRQLYRVAQLIKMRDAGAERAVFAIGQGGWDSHNTHDLSGNIGQLNTGIRDFVTEMKAQNMWDDVVLMPVSEFGRTTTSNGRGTDHGWAGNTFMMGGSVKGTQILGSYPTNIGDDSPQSLGRGRMIPDLPWDGVWKPLIEWFGVEDSAIDTVLPNVKNFPSDQLVDRSDMFV